MKKRQVLSALIAGTLAAMVFTGCGEDGKIPQDNNKDNSSNPSDMVSDAGDGIGDVVSDMGEGMSDMGEDVSDGMSDMTDGNDTNTDDKTDSEWKGDESSWSDKNTSSHNGVNDPALNDDSVSALEPVETEKKTLA